jgi:hypothetical protein
MTALNRNQHFPLGFPIRGTPLVPGTKALVANAQARGDLDEMTTGCPTP